MDIDVNDLREATIALYELDRVDEVYTLYYDETNNIRRLHITRDGLNVRDPGCFVLGGIAHRGQPHDLGFAELRSALKVQKSVKELKLKHIGRGAFLEVLSAERLTALLSWIIERDLFIHFQALDVMYWSIVDIVDSILTETRSSALMSIGGELKNDLYIILRANIDHTVDLFKRYSYPNVGPQRRTAFVRELLDILEQRSDLLPEFNYQMLKGLLQMATAAHSLPYLENEDPNVLIDEFSNFYVARISLFKNSTHILDVEDLIRARLSAMTFMDKGQPLHIHRFVDSKAEPGVQVADTVAGLLGKALTLAIGSNGRDLRQSLSRFSSTQVRNLSLLGTFSIGQLPRVRALQAMSSAMAIGKKPPCSSIFDEYSGGSSLNFAVKCAPRVCANDFESRAPSTTVRSLRELQWSPSPAIAGADEGSPRKRPPILRQILRPAQR
jgi:hypothetical protein